MARVTAVNTSIEFTINITKMLILLYESENVVKNRRTILDSLEYFRIMSMAVQTNMKLNIKCLRFKLNSDISLVNYIQYFQLL